MLVDDFLKQERKPYERRSFKIGVLVGSSITVIVCALLSFLIFDRYITVAVKQHLDSLPLPQTNITVTNTITNWIKK